MFNPKTDKIKNIADERKKFVEELDFLLDEDTLMYIDYANVKNWSNHLGWHIEIKRLKQFLDSFSQIKNVYLYHGLLEGDKNSEQEVKKIENCNYTLRSKSVKIMKHSIDVSSIDFESKNLLKQFIRSTLLRKLALEEIEYFNKCFLRMNNNGELFLEDRKCNFDVEIGIDMILDSDKTKTNIFVLWSGDSDFVDPIKRLLAKGKKVILFSTSRKTASELNKLREEGLTIFDIKKIKEFICRNSEYLKAKGTPKGP